jgi:hypothetical protein
MSNPSVTHFNAESSPTTMSNPHTTRSVANFNTEIARLIAGPGYGCPHPDWDATSQLVLMCPYAELSDGYSWGTVSNPDRGRWVFMEQTTCTHAEAVAKAVADKTAADKAAADKVAADKAAADKAMSDRVAFDMSVTLPLPPNDWPDGWSNDLPYN